MPARGRRQVPHPVWGTPRAPRIHRNDGDEGRGLDRPGWAVPTPRRAPPTPWVGAKGPDPPQGDNGGSGGNQGDPVCPPTSPDCPVPGFSGQGASGFGWGCTSPGDAEGWRGQTGYWGGGGGQWGGPPPHPRSQILLWGVQAHQSRGIQAAGRARPLWPLLCPAPLASSPCAAWPRLGGEHGSGCTPKRVCVCVPSSPHCTALTLEGEIQQVLGAAQPLACHLDTLGVGGNGWAPTHFHGGGSPPSPPCAPTLCPNPLGTWGAETCWDPFASRGSSSSSSSL